MPAPIGTTARYRALISQVSRLTDRRTSNLGFAMLDRSALIKIAKLIPHLNSHSEIDIAAAARAIGRILKAENADWHDLAAALSGENADARIQTVLRRCRDVLERLDLEPHEARFINQVIGNYEINPDWTPSEKQGRWMASLLNRLARKNGGA